VLKRFMIIPPDKGLTMNIWAVDGLASMGICLAALDSFARAPANASGFPETLAPPASASYSLDLDMAIWINVAATGATMATAMVFIMPPSSLLPKNMAHRDNKTTALAIVAAIVLIRIPGHKDAIVSFDPSSTVSISWFYYQKETGLQGFPSSRKGL
jgi:hypothetical protein